MLIRLGYDIEFDLPNRTPILSMLHIHSTRLGDLLEPDVMAVTPSVPVEFYTDGFGNRVGRLVAPAGPLRLSCQTVIDDSGNPDELNFGARELPVEELPHEVLPFLLSSRYCEVDRLSAAALELFGGLVPGWGRVQAICDWVHARVSFNYYQTRLSKTAVDVFTERVGVCRDFQHLAITFCRCLNIPARYATGYLPDIGVPLKPPMDFSAWFEVFLDGRWWTFDARNNIPRIGRVLIAVGRDASDVAITTSFGIANLISFNVTSEEVLNP